VKVPDSRRNHHRRQEQFVEYLDSLGRAVPGYRARDPRGRPCGLLTLRGQGGSPSIEELIGELAGVLEVDFLGGGTRSEPKTVRELAARIRALEQAPGIYARFDRRPARLAHTSDEVAYEGRVRLRLRVTPRGRR
jgi:hypothetical protein